MSATVAPRSRLTRALVAAGAGLVGAAAVVCATVTLTHSGHHAVHVASLTPLPPVAKAPPPAVPAGLLPWRAPASPPPLRLAPVVVGDTLVVQTTRYVTAGGEPAPTRSTATPRVTTTPRVTSSRQPATTRRTSSTTRRTTERRTTWQRSGTRHRTDRERAGTTHDRDGAAAESSHESHESDGGGDG